MFFLYFFLWSWCILTSQVEEVFVFHQANKRGFVFHGSTPQADPQPRTQTTNAHHTSRQGHQGKHRPRGVS